MFSRWLPWIKGAVFIAVLLGLGRAGWTAATRWQDESARLVAQAHQFTRQAEAIAATSPAEAARLQRQAERLQRSVPSWAAIHWPYLLAAAGCYGLGLFPPAWVLHRCLLAFRVPCDLPRTVAAQLIGHAGKYLPGKAMVIVLRVGTINGGNREQDGSSTTNPAASLTLSATVCVFYETLLMMSVGGVLAGVLLCNSELPMWIRLGAVAVAVGACLPTFPPVMRWVIRRISKRKKQTANLPTPRQHSAEQTSEDAITWRLLLETWLVSALSWILIGFSMTFLMHAIPSHAPALGIWHGWPIATAAITLGMVLGFASLLPGGAGVREYVTLLVLSPLTGTTHALLCVIAARFLFIAVESALALLSYFWIRHSP